MRSSPGRIGSAAVDELLAAGHDVTGLARSDDSVAALEASPGTPGTAPTTGRRSTAPTPRASSRSRWPRPQPAPACMRWARRRCRSGAVAEAIGDALHLPVTSIGTDDVAAHFGWIGAFFGMEMSATSRATRELLGWTPTGPTLLEDIAAGAYAAACRRRPRVEARTSTALGLRRTYRGMP